MSSEETATKRKRDGEDEEGSSGGVGAAGEKEDAKWEYSAPSIPTSHWIDRGFDQQYIAAMELFLKRIKKYTSELRSGTASDEIILGSGGGGGPVGLHDDALQPHWREFVNSMQLYKNPAASFCIQIKNMQLSSSVMSLLAPALKDKPIKTFVLSNNEFENAREGIDFAIEIIQSNPGLKQFYWGNNPIHSMNDANHLVEAVISHPRIYCIHLPKCFGENVDVYSILCTLLASGKEFSRIKLKSNDIQTGWGTEIPDFLATNPPLNRLVLTNNHLDDNDAVLIARSLKRNTNLRRLGLGHNGITDIGRDALSSTIFDSTSLNAVEASNHSCSIEGLYFDSIVLNNVGDCKVNRERKIYSLLSTRNREGTNVQHLDAEFEDLKLVPKVLEAVRHYAVYGSSVDDVHPLSIMYEALRSWKMPTLYESNGAS